MPRPKQRTTKTDVRLAWDVHWCHRHLEPYKPRWPHGSGRAMIMLFDVAAGHDSIVRACGGDPERGTLADASKLDAALRVFAPLCCLVGDVAMERIYAKTLWGQS